MSIISEARPYTLENIESEPDLPGVYEIINETEDPVRRIRNPARGSAYRVKLAPLRIC